MSLDDSNKPGFLATTNGRLIAIGAAAAIVIGAAGAYFAFGHGGVSGAANGPRTAVVQGGMDSLVAAANDAASSENGGICERALTRAQSYGIVPASSTLTSKQTETAVQGRYTCAVKTGEGATFTLAVDQTCDDLANHDCLALHTVTQADGRTLFERL